MVGGDYEVMVLEPSPPAVTEPPFADDPLSPPEVPDGRLLVSPVRSHGDMSWDEVARGEARDRRVVRRALARGLAAAGGAPARVREDAQGAPHHRRGPGLAPAAARERDRAALHARRLRHPLLRDGRRRLPGQGRAQRADPHPRRRGAAAPPHPRRRSRGRPRAGRVLRLRLLGAGGAARGGERRGALAGAALARALRHRLRRSARRRRAGAPPTAPRPATTSTPSPTSTCFRWGEFKQGELWNATAFKGAELATPSCSRPTTSAGPRSTSSASGTRR